MRSRSQGRRRSVDRGTCGPDIQPRKKLPPGRRRCKEKRKAPSGAPISRGVPESRAARDPVHVRRQLAWEPGGLCANMIPTPTEIYLPSVKMLKVKADFKSR